MSKLKALVVDDEDLARSRLCRLLAKLEVDVVDECVNGEEAVLAAAKGFADVIFLDIEMPLKNGLDAAAEIGALDNAPAIIFCTAYDQYALHAFKTSASAYLLKPVNEAAIAEALDKVKCINSVQLSTLLNSYSAAPSLTVRHRGEARKIPATSFVGFQAIDKHTHASLVDGEKLVIDYTLKQLEELVPDLVLRIHRSVLVIKAEMVRLYKDDSGSMMLELSDGSCFSVSRRHLNEVKKCFD